MALPPLPLSAVPLELPVRASVGDVGASVAANLTGGDTALVYLPTGSTVQFTATERAAVPERGRRAPRVITGAAVISAALAYQVSYALQAADTATEGSFDMVFAVTFPASAGTLNFPAGHLEICNA